MIFCCDGGSMLNSEGESYSADIVNLNLNFVF